MMNSSNLLELEMTPTGNGYGGSFSAQATFKLDNIPLTFKRIDVKIDTGCSLTTIPLQRIGIPQLLCRNLKSKDIKDGVEYVLSYGVETGGTSHARPATDNERLDCEALKFIHPISKFSINGVKIGDSNVYVNYDRHGNVLIGMDIMKNWNSHMGKDKYGRIIFLSDVTGKNSEDFKKRLNYLFDI